MDNNSILQPAPWMRTVGYWASKLLVFPPVNDEIWIDNALLPSGRAGDLQFNWRQYVGNDLYRRMALSGPEGTKAFEREFGHVCPEVKAVAKDPAAPLSMPWSFRWTPDSDVMSCPCGVLKLLVGMHPPAPPRRAQDYLSDSASMDTARALAVWEQPHTAPLTGMGTSAFKGQRVRNDDDDEMRVLNASSLDMDMDDPIYSNIEALSLSSGDPWSRLRQRVLEQRPILADARHVDFPTWHPSTPDAPSLPAYNPPAIEPPDAPRFSTPTSVPVPAPRQRKHAFRPRQSDAERAFVQRYKGRPITQGSGRAGNADKWAAGAKPAALWYDD